MLSKSKNKLLEQLDQLPEKQLLSTFYEVLGKGDIELATDMLRGLSPEETETNLRSIIQSLQKENIPILILGMQSVASNGIAYKKQFDAIYPRLAKDYSLPLVPFFLEGVALNQALNTGDGIHPNKEGYSLIISKNINPVLLPYLEKTINARQ
jgi:acyl-CoA thioesterase-1